uniref:Uncharacterized protein n=1 Tax=Quercus lobata TaxID=97700 RepID=A0A7N2LQK0_QUELO
MELIATEEKEAGSDPELKEVKVRLDKLEEAVKEIVVETRNNLLVAQNLWNQDQGLVKSVSGAPVPEAFLQDQKGKMQNGVASQGAKT